MRKLSLFILAAGATLGVAFAQADDAVDTGSLETGGVDPVVITDPAVEEPVAVTCDDCVEITSTEETVTDETVIDETVTDETVTDETVADDSGAADDTEVADGSTDDVPVKYDDTQIYMTTTSTDTGPTRGTEGCMECRNLTGTGADSGAVEAPAPEITADVLDGNATGVDVMDPAEAKKRK